MRHDAVLAAALVGLPEGEGAHHPLVFVTLRPGQAVDAGALLDFVRASGDRVPPGLSVEVVDAMPMTPTGKISKAELLERATAG
jgi:acyl-coenzyme A synthetase/AMP-(fatty) acid ligase